MEQESKPSYDGRATVYLDQNVLTMALKERDPDFFRRLVHGFQVVYSDDTLREIKRSGHPEKFLQVLCDLNAMHFKYELEPSFNPTGRVLLCSLSPHQAYDHYLTIEPVYDALLAAAHQSTLKMYGGRKDSSFEDISDEQVDAFQRLIDHLSAQRNELVDSHPEVADGMAKQIDSLQEQYNAALLLSAQEMAKHVDEANEVSGISRYREAVGAGPKQLNNIEAPNVIQKIWAMYQDLEGYKGMGFSIDDFLGISVNPIYGRAMHQHEQVTGIYNVLNVIGYKPDSRLDRENRHVAAISDAAHAAIASHAQLLLSADTAFVAKARAIYEYLQIPTDVGLVSSGDDPIIVSG
jgi:hypothetical protein